MQTGLIPRSKTVVMAIGYRTEIEMYAKGFLETMYNVKRLHLIHLTLV